MPRGLIWDGNELFVVDAAPEGVNLGAAGTVMYKLSDAVLEEGVTFDGDTVEAPRDAAATYDALVDNLRANKQMLQAGVAAEGVEISILADAAYLARYSNETQARDAPEKGEHAVAGRQRAVHVEHRDGRARGGARFGHGRTRLYTRDVSDGPEIFDDLYLGLQAGGALRKQRRGEELTEQEREAIGRWQQMSMWRKGVAIGAFAVGTFGLGFTLGGLVFGRRARKA